MAQYTHQGKSPMEKRTSAWLQAKQMIVEQDFDSGDMLMLAKAIAPSNPLTQCTMGYDSIKMEITGEVRVVPAFTLELYLPSRECAKMLSLCMTGHGLNLPFKADISFDKASDDLPGYIMKVKSRGEFTPRGVRGMAYTINVEQYAKYTIFRSLNNFLAKSAIYAFDNNQPPEQTIFPVMLPTGALTGKSLSDQVVLAERVFLPSSKEIDAIISNGLTTVDLLDLKGEFVRGVIHTPREMHQYALSAEGLRSGRTAQNNPADSNSTRRRFG